MVTLRWDALRLTLDETRAIARSRNITDESTVSALHGQSEGGAAGIALMLEHVARASTAEGAPPAYSRESVFHYLAALLFADAPVRSRHVLLSVALLPQIPRSIAIVLSGDDHAPDVLESLHRRQLFVQKRAGPEPVYQLHALLREFLSARLAETLPPPALDHLRRRSADALVDVGQIDAGFALRAQMGDWDAAVTLIEHQAEVMLNTGRWQTLAGWVETLPEAVRRSHPMALYWLGMARASLDPVSAMEVLRDALDRLDRQGDRRGRLLCLAGLLGATVPGYSAVGMTDQWIDAILPGLDAMHEILSPRVQLQVWGGMCTPLLFARPWHPRVFEPPRRIRDLLPHVQDPRTRILAATGALGRLRRTLSVVLGVTPSAESERLYREILSGMANHAEGHEDKSP
jgi:LuxR family transcriptional regulator, maltose regulon positive regulatory protein